MVTRADKMQGGVGAFIAALHDAKWACAGCVSVRRGRAQLPRRVHPWALCN
jgi:hypothetical protein